MRLVKASGHLHVLQPIGRTAFGRVHRARDTRLDREVLPKFLSACSDTAMRVHLTVSLRAE